ncbi:MAG TPA: response regulator [Spirochaetia bacterium]|nr:response regulator [Spirochaetia bacterium]
MAKRVLIIDDEEMVLDAVTTILEDLGYEITPCMNPSEGALRAVSEPFDLILCDLRMPLKNGAEVSADILKQRPDAKILIITAYPNDPLAAKALASGVSGLIKKPFEIAKILEYLKE